MNIEFFACGIMILFAGTASVLHGMPAIWSPMPLLVVIPSFLIGATPIRRVADLPFGDLIFSALAAAPITIAYFAWSIGPVATSKIPVRSVVLLALTAVFTLVSLFVGWKAGVRSQGLTHTIAVAVVNFLLAAATFFALVIHSKSPSYGLSLCFHGTLFLWLAWFAFPWLGENWDD